MLHSFLAVKPPKGEWTVSSDLAIQTAMQLAPFFLRAIVEDDPVFGAAAASLELHRLIALVDSKTKATMDELVIFQVFDLVLGSGVDRRLQQPHPWNFIV